MQEQWPRLKELKAGESSVGAGLKHDSLNMSTVARRWARTRSCLWLGAEDLSNQVQCLRPRGLETRCAKCDDVYI